MAHVAPLIEDFPETLKPFMQSPPTSAKDIRDKIVQLKASVPPIHTEAEFSKYFKARNGLLSKLIGSYLVSRLSEHYPMLSPKLFDLKRCIYINRAGKVAVDQAEPFEPLTSDQFTKCEMALIQRCVFAASYKSPGQITLGTWSIRHAENTTKTNILANVPLPPTDVLAAARKATALYHNVIASIFEDVEIADLGNMAALEPKLETIWIPKADSMTVEVEVVVPKPRRYDPAVIMTIGDSTNHYLIKTWDIPEEESITRYLREFTIGDVKLANL